MSTTEKLNQLLQKLDIDEDIMTLLNNERITSTMKESPHFESYSTLLIPPLQI